MIMFQRAWIVMSMYSCIYISVGYNQWTVVDTSFVTQTCVRMIHACVRSQSTIFSAYDAIKTIIQIQGLVKHPYFIHPYPIAEPIAESKTSISAVQNYWSLHALQFVVSIGNTNGYSVLHRWVLVAKETLVFCMYVGIHYSLFQKGYHSRSM